MKSIFKILRTDLNFYILSFVWLFALLNPVFKKFDYGNGFPVVVMLIVLTVPMVIWEFNKKREKALAERFALAVFGLFVVLSFVGTAAKNIGFSEVMAFLSMIPVYIILAYRRVEWMDRFLRLMVFGAFATAFIGMLLYYFKPQMRLYGSFLNMWHYSNVWPNAFALFLIMTWPIFLLVFKKKWNVWFIGLLGFVGAAFILSFSRGALIAMLGQVFLLAIFYYRKLNWQTIKIAIAVILTGLLFFHGVNFLRSSTGSKHATIKFNERITFSEGFTSTEERLDFWIASIALIEDKPILGHGPFTFRQAYNPIQKSFLGNSDHPHNLFLKVAVENGLIAASALFIFFFIVFVSVVRRFSGLKKEDRDKVLILAVAIAGAFAHSIIDYNFNFVINLLQFFILIAFVRSIVVRKKDKKDVKPFFSLVLSLIMALFAIYEGTLFGLTYIVSPDLAADSVYPRQYHTFKAFSELSGLDFDEANKMANRAIELNPLDSEGYYLRGLTQCDKRSPYLMPQSCLGDLKKALELNPMNDIRYYRDYMAAFIEYGDTESEEFEIFYAKAQKILEIYFYYASLNIHFTAYTENVEAAAELVEQMKPFMNEGIRGGYEAQVRTMLEFARIYRGGRTF